MKLVIPFDYNKFLVFPAEQAGVLVPALSTAGYFEKKYDDKTYKAIPFADRKLEFSFESDDMFGEQPEAFVALQNSRDESEKKYLNEWTKGNQLQKQIRELPAKLESLKARISPSTPPATPEEPSPF